MSLSWMPKACTSSLTKVYQTTDEVPGECVLVYMGAIMSRTPMPQTDGNGNAFALSLYAC